jgi:hypothetical protein
MAKSLPVMNEFYRLAGVPSSSLGEKIECDKGCMKKYQSDKGAFKGKKGERFSNCEKAFDTCCTGVEDSSAVCAAIGRKAGKI